MPSSQSENVPKYDARNTLNDLTGREWIKLTKSFWTSEKSGEDKFALQHPAPFLLKDTMKLISMFTKEDMKVLDPFLGSGTTLLAASRLKRRGHGIDLNPEYIDMARIRLEQEGATKNQKLHLGDSREVLSRLRTAYDYCVTSPPYHNILRNKGAGIRSEKKNYRSGARTGIDYYSEHEQDLGNFDEYEDFLESFTEIMALVKRRLKIGGYCTIVMSDFTVNKVEQNVQGHVIARLSEIGFTFEGTQVLLQETKPLYPFGYPYAFKVNHHHQNMMHFRNRNSSIV
jgi:DNA modification methylase